LTHLGILPDPCAAGGPSILITLADAVRHFADQVTALKLIASLRWHDGVLCPHCASGAPTFLTSRQIWKCRAAGCRKQFSVRIGTIFEDSALGLHQWLACLWAIANNKDGIGSQRIAHALGITQKSAWFMRHRVRLAMQTRAFAAAQADRHYGVREAASVAAGISTAGESQASLERLAAFTRRLLAVPKVEIDREASAWLRARRRGTR
jgi:transposase-like protein